MGLKVRPEISRRKEYWLPKHRQLELVHFCLQYPEWKQLMSDLDGCPSGQRFTERVQGGMKSSPVEQIVERRMELEAKIEMIEDAAKEAAADLYPYLLRGVTDGIGYEMLGIPCCKDVYYRIYRKFFWILDRARK